MTAGILSSYPGADIISQKDVEPVRRIGLREERRNTAVVKLHGVEEGNDDGKIYSRH
jgi:hypothetical protein